MRKKIVWEDKLVTVSQLIEICRHGLDLPEVNENKDFQGEKGKKSFEVYNMTYIYTVSRTQNIVINKNYTDDKFVLDDSKGSPGSWNKSGSVKVYSCYRVIEVTEVPNDCTYESISEFFGRLHL